MRAKDVLLEALRAYSGTVVFVSHDRYFIDKLATRVFEIGEGQVRVYPGNYEDYLWRKQGNGETLVASSAAVQSTVTSAPAALPTPAQDTQVPPAKRLNPIKLRQMKERCQEVEEEIVRLEAAVAGAESALQDFVSVEETQRQTALLENSRRELEERMAEWEELAQTLESH
jgi:ATP-binding cassette, subfamily F, member 3